MVDNPAIWRPVLAMQDAVAAYVRAVEASPEVSGIFNVASGNYTVGEIADCVKEALDARRGGNLHLEIRNAGQYNRAYNPIPLIGADWDTLALTGAFSPGFARDLSDPRRWQTLAGQPDIAFWGARLNDYENPWPPEWGR